MSDLIARIKRQYHSVGRGIQGRPLRVRAELVAYGGNVKVPGHEEFCYARIHGTSASSLHLVLNTAAPAVEGLAVLVERERGVMGFTPQYTVVGVWSGNPDYNEEPIAPGLPLHADTHERMSWGVLGVDPVDVYTRMIVQGRVDPTNPPSMAVHVAYIRYRWAGQLRAFPNTITSNLSAPSAMPQVALVYFVPAQNTYGIRYGPAGFPATEPGAGEGECPLASIYLTPSMTSITDSMIVDRRDILTMSALEQEGGGDVITTIINNVEQTIIIEASDADFVHEKLRMALPVTLC